jgi:hypothetical protein
MVERDERDERDRDRETRRSERKARRNERKRSHHDNPWARLVWGAAFFAAGLIGWMDHTGQLHASDYIQWWPLVFIGLGLAHLPQRQWVSAAVLTAIGVLFLPSLPFLPQFRLAAILGLTPLLISFGGITLIRQALWAATEGSDPATTFHSVAIMGGVGRSVANDFVGGDAVAIMAGCEINLGAAKITESAVIDVLAFWGGIDIRVPRGWRIDNQVLAILGGVVDKTDGVVVAGAPTLIIRGSAIMGGVEVKHPKDYR